MHRGEDAGQNGAQRAADAVDAEGIQRIVVAELRLELRAGEEADDARGDAHRQRGHRLHEARGRRDAHQARDQARGSAQHARLAADDPFHAGPGQRAGRGGKVRRAEGAGGQAVARPARCRR